MNAAYFTAAVPEPFRILGLTLKPLSIGRYRLLRRFNCAFVAEEEENGTGEDLLIGVLICSQRCDEFVAWANSGHFSRDVKRWGKRVCRRRWLSRIPGMGRYWRQHHAFDLLEKMELFKRYISQGAVVPMFWDESEGTSSSGAHWSQGMEVILRGELNWSAEEINEQPLSKGFADYFKFLENKKAIRLMTEWEIDLVKKGEEEERKAKAT